MLEKLKYLWVVSMVRVRSLLLASVISALFAVSGAIGAANAQQPRTLTATAFLTNTEQLLQSNPNGGALLANAVQYLVLLDPATFKVIIGLLPKANELQKKALTQATRIAVLIDQELAQEWQGQISQISEPIFKAGALREFGDVEIGLVGGATGGYAGAGLGGPGRGEGRGGGKAQGGLRYNAVHTSFLLLPGGATGSGRYSTTAPKSPVSPSR